MACKYILRGINFNSEEELNDFLLNLEGNQSSLNDVVYQKLDGSHIRLTAEQNNYRKLLLEAENEYSKYEKQGIQLKSLQETEEVEPEDLDDVGSFKYPFISVTDLIHSLRGRKTEYAFPIFKSNEYWKEKFELYRNGTFDSYELQFISDLLEKDPVTGNYKPVQNQIVLDKIRDRIEGKLANGIRKGGLWKQQAQAGNLVHDVFARFYRDTIGIQNPDGTWKKGPHLYELKNNEDQILSYFEQKYRDNRFATKPVLKSLIQQCIKFDNELRNKYGKDCFIRTEQKIVSDLDYKVDENNKATKVIGKIDLVVIGDKDHKGQIGIIDFKCSPKDYTTSNAANDPKLYNSAKILTFKYQLAVYRRILKAMGVNPQRGGIDLFVVPLKFENFKMDNNEKVSFDGVSSLDTMLQKLSNSDGGIESTNIESNLDQVFPPKGEFYTRTGDATNIVENTKKVVKEWFSIVDKAKSAEDYANYIKEVGGIQFDEQSGEYYFKPNKYNDNGIIDKIKAKTKEEATAKIIDELKRRDDYKQSYVSDTTSQMRKKFVNYYFKDDVENPMERISDYTSSSSSSKRNTDYLRDNLSKYTNREVWRPIPEKLTDQINATLDQFGILLFQNKASGLIDVVRISGDYMPTRRVKLKGNEYILGNYMPDSTSHNSADSLTMISTRGNIELIETMIVLNQMAGIFEDSDLKIRGIGNIKAMCPSAQIGTQVPNEQLLYNFARLCQQNKNIITNNFITKNSSEGTIKMATYLDLLKQDFDEIRLKNNTEGLSKLKPDVKQSVSKFDFKDKTLEEIKQDLITLDQNLVHYHKEVTQNIQDKLNDESPQFRLHKDILYAIAELSGVKMVQQIEEHKRWDVNLSKDKLGISGTMVDNPGTLQSAILNQATNQVTIAYQNTRDSVAKFDQVLKEKVRKLKEKKGFNWISQNITGNQTKDLYYNMYDHKSSDVKFINPWDENQASGLTTEEIEFLKYAIIKINSTRGNGLNLEALLANPDLMGKLIAGDETGKYLRVPLVKGDFASEVAIRGGLFNFIRDRFKYLSVWNLETRKLIKKKIDDNVTGLLDTSTQEIINKGDQWEAINNMSRLDTDLDYRERKIRERGKAYFEHNLETLLLKQHSAYVMAEELNKVFPVIQSLLIHLNAQGSILNTKFTNDVKYLLDYIKTKIHNQPIEDRTKQEAKIRDIANETMKWASRLALAYNIRQTYQFLDGIWQDIKLVIKYKEFTRENLFWAWKFVMSDLFTKYGDKKSLPELLNQQYGINDMDMNTYIDRIKSDNTGLFTHFWDTGFRFASRPDYYNRMTIFLAQMKNDGSFEAHSVKNNKLIYNWTKDKRFKAFAENSSNKEEYNKAKSAYITLARQLMEEGALNEDGTLFKMNIMHPELAPLPKAYSNRESEGRKAFADRIYGYYAHEKKSMFNSTFVGALTMQMNTYWSAKKNQWIQQSSYTQEGHWVDYVEDGIPYYWKIGENGELEITKEPTGLPVQVWKGNPQEGIIVTVSKLISAFNGNYEGIDESGIKGVKELLRGDKIDPDLQRLYAANFRQLWYDLLMLLLLGIFASRLLQSGAKQYAKEHTNDNFANALANTALNAGVGIIQSSGTDFNPFESIFGRGVQWTPFSIQSAKNTFNQYKSFLKGNQDLYDAVIKTSAATKTTAPLWEYVKLKTMGVKIGQKPGYGGGSYSGGGAGGRF